LKQLSEVQGEKTAPSKDSSARIVKFPVFFILLGPGFTRWRKKDGFPSLSTLYVFFPPDFFVLVLPVFGLQHGVF